MWTQFLGGQAPLMQNLMGNYLEQSKSRSACRSRCRRPRRCSRACRASPGQEVAAGARPGGCDAGQSRHDRHPTPRPPRAPTVGFVSLGCPKALTDSELILTQLRAEGYETSKTFAGADLVIVNTCGFIDDAVKESLDTIGEALAENGKVIVTGCLGAKAGDGGGNLVQQVHPKVLAVTGPHATQEVMDAVHRHVPKPHDPFVDLVPEARAEFRGIRHQAHAAHYAYLKISEGCNHRCTFCIIPSMRGDLVSRPVGDVLGEARALFESA
jgi:ribosomal protein S12 methylthiotransferase